MKKSTNSWIWVLGLVTVAGCTNSFDSIHTKMFDESDGDEARMAQLNKAQSDAGTREDATLQAMNFDGSALNASGSEKLAALLPTQSDGEVTLYLDFPTGDLSDSRKQTVLAYFASQGVEAAHVKIENGPNPNLHNPAGVGLAGLEKMNSPVETSNGVNAVSAATTAK